MYVCIFMYVCIHPFSHLFLICLKNTSEYYFVSQYAKELFEIHLLFLKIDILLYFAFDNPLKLETHPQKKKKKKASGSFKPFPSDRGDVRGSRVITLFMS